MGKKITKEDFLAAHKIHERVFMTGMFYSGITIYNQQVRTLNLIYYLLNESIISPASAIKDSSQVVIVGGGVSGLTAAIAFSRNGYKVSIIEEKSLMLHLQHGCTTRQIHPNLFLWPQPESAKPFTELPFGNWEASDAARIEKTLNKEFNDEKKKSRITEYNNSKECKVNLKTNKINFTSGTKKSRKFHLLILATGFGLEKYVGKREKAKSYWRNDDLAQLRLKDQLKKYFVSGVGDGGLSDVFRLSLVGFDPLELARLFEKVAVNNENLINDLRIIERKTRHLVKYNYAYDFLTVYNKYQISIEKIIQSIKRLDISDLILNGKKAKFEDNLTKGKMSFLNGWVSFVLFKIRLFRYHGGTFPDACGEFVSDYEEENQFQVIIRHGTDKNMEHFRRLHESFESSAQSLATLQNKKRINDFSMFRHWPLEFWTRVHQPHSYIAKEYIVSKELVSSCSLLLTIIHGIINNYSDAKLGFRIDFRITLHRLAFYSGEYLFQQLCEYKGTRVEGKAGRAFPISEGIVGLAIRSNKCFSLIRSSGESGGLFNYASIFARPLSPSIDYFLAIPIPAKSLKVSVLCLYFDTKHQNIVDDVEFRKLLYWSLTSFIKELDNQNVGEPIIKPPVNTKTRITDSMKLIQTPGLTVHDAEIEAYRNESELIMSTDKLIELYAK